MTAIKTFEDYWEIVVSNELWYDRVKYQYARKDIKKVAQEAFIDLLTQPIRLQKADATDFQKHLSKFLMYAKDEPVRPQLQQQEVKVSEPSEPPLTGEEKKAWLDQWLEEVLKMEDRKIRPLLPDQKEELGGERPPKPKGHCYPKTPAEVLEAKELHIQYIRENYDPITAKPLPTWISEEEWLKKTNPHTP